MSAAGSTEQPAPPDVVVDVEDPGEPAMHVSLSLPVTRARVHDVMGVLSRVATGLALDRHMINLSCTPYDDEPDDESGPS